MLWAFRVHHTWLKWFLQAVTVVAVHSFEFHARSVASDDSVTVRMQVQIA